MAPARKQSTTTTAIEVGAGLAAVAAAASAGYYFYGDAKAKKHRAAATSWAKGMKAQVIKEAKKLPAMDQKTMGKVVDAAAAAYASARSVNKNDVDAAARELKKHWKTIQAEVQGVAKSVGSKAKKAVSKAAPKKAVKKVAPKKAAKKAPAKKTAKAPAKKSTKRAR